ncbi:MAG: RNase P subunit p30 family protein [Candidatus Thorarchaeota archaeon]|jgi:RNase P/RNase MRP subunit p30
MPIDMNVRVPKTESLDAFAQMAIRLGFTGIASPLSRSDPIESMGNGLALLTRTDVNERGIRAVTRAVEKARFHSAVVSVPLGETRATNWAAEDSRVDLLSVVEPLKGASLRKSTAKLAAASDTALEVSIAPLLGVSGLTRSKVVKGLRETTQTALDAGMPIVLSSGSINPITMRSPRALCYVGLLLGLDWHGSERAVYENPERIFERNKKRLGRNYVKPGVEIVERGGPG